MCDVSVKESLSIAPIRSAVMGSYNVFCLIIWFVYI